MTNFGSMPNKENSNNETNIEGHEIFFEPAIVLRELEALDDGTTAPDSVPDRLPIIDIELKTALFQPRGLDERHIQELKRSLKASGDLDPVTVIYLGGKTILLDGHHRVAAYEITDGKTSVPVSFFQGTLKEAVLEAGKANSKAKLPMTSAQRQDYAWRLVLLGEGFSKKQIKEASGVSDGQVANMRRVKRKLGNIAFETSNWWAAWKAYKDQDGNNTSEYDDEWIEAQANEYADRLSKEFGTKLANNVTIAARALEIHFGRRISDLAYELQDFTEDDDEFEF